MREGGDPVAPFAIGTPALAIGTLRIRFDAKCKRQTKGSDENLQRRRELQDDSVGLGMIEMMVVIMIIGIMVGAAVLVFFTAQGAAKSDACQENQRILNTAVDAFRNENRRPPDSPDELVPSYIQEIPREPFGGTYILVPESDTAPAHIICSIGHTQVIPTKNP